MQNSSPVTPIAPLISGFTSCSPLTCETRSGTVATAFADFVQRKLWPDWSTVASCNSLESSGRNLSGVERQAIAYWAEQKAQLTREIKLINSSLELNIFFAEPFRKCQNASVSATDA